MVYIEADKRDVGEGRPECDLCDIGILGEYNSCREKFSGDKDSRPCKGEGDWLTTD